MDYYLKADSEQAMWEVLIAVGAAQSQVTKNEEGEIVETRYIPAAGYSIDIIGTIYKPTGNYIQKVFENNIMEVPEMQAVEGFHANLRGPIDLAPKVEIIPYQPTAEESMDPDFVQPEPTITTTPSPIQSILVDPAPKNPVRKWF